MLTVPSIPVRKQATVTFVCLCIFSSIHAGLSTQASVLVDALAWVTSMMLCGLVIQAAEPRSFHSLLVISTLVWIGLSIGAIETATCILFLLSAWCVGIVVLNFCLKASDTARRVTEPVLIGVTVWFAIWGLMLHFSVNYRVVYLVLGALPFYVLFTEQTVGWAYYERQLGSTHEWMCETPRTEWIAGCTVIGWVLRWATFPTLGFDDQALHLRLWTELLTLHRFTFDVQTHVGSVLPFAVDLLHGVMSILTGSDTRSAINFILALLLCVLMVRILHKWSLSARSQWLSLVLMASTPMLGSLLLTMHAELMLSVLALVGLLLVVEAKQGCSGRQFLGMASCAALCAATKFSGAVLGMALLATMMLQWFTHRAGFHLGRSGFHWLIPCAFVPPSFVAIHSYWIAWTLTGNPVFPFYNEFFRSDYFGLEPFRDERWVHGFTLWSYIRVFFLTSEFGEMQNYSAGWQYLFVLPISLLVLSRPDINNQIKITLVPMLIFGAAMFSATQYWRYLFPALTLAGCVIGATFENTPRTLRRGVIGLAIACIVGNLLRFQGASWLMGSPPSMALSQAGKVELARIYAPAMQVTNKINGLYPGARVLYPFDTPYGATLHGTPLYVNWYSPFRAARLRTVTDFNGISDFILREQVDLVVADTARVRIAGSPENILQEFLARYGSIVVTGAGFDAFRISASSTLYRNVFDLGASVGREEGSASLMLPSNAAGVSASAEPKLLAAFRTLGSKQARYSVEFRCRSKDGYFVAQINWDSSPAYYRLVSCSSVNVVFNAALSIPLGEQRGQIYVTARDTEDIEVSSLIVAVQ